MCSCNNGLLLQTDGRSCQCGGRLTAASGSFQTDGWPNAYRRQNFQCEWIIELPDSSATIQFTIDPSAFGIPGRAPACTSDHIEFFDGPRSSASSLKKICGLIGFYGGTIPSINTTLSTARVVFTGSNRNRPPSRVGVKVSYITIPPPGMRYWFCVSVAAILLIPPQMLMSVHVVYMAVTTLVKTHLVHTSATVTVVSLCLVMMAELV